MTPDQLRERLQQFAAAVSRFCGPLFDSPRWRSNADQISRSSASAMANYRADGSARSPVEFTTKTGQALKEMDAKQSWLQHLGMSSAIAQSDRARFAELSRECSELTAILTAATATARRRDAADRALRRR